MNHAVFHRRIRRKIEQRKWKIFIWSGHVLLRPSLALFALIFGFEWKDRSRDTFLSRIFFRFSIPMYLEDASSFDTANFFIRSVHVLFRPFLVICTLIFRFEWNDRSKDTFQRVSFPVSIPMYLKHTWSFDTVNFFH